MKIKVIVVIASIVAASMLMTGGYSLWEKKLLIKGNIDVVNPEANVEEAQNITVFEEAYQTDTVIQTNTETVVEEVY